MRLYSTLLFLIITGALPASAQSLAEAQAIADSLAITTTAVRHVLALKAVTVPTPPGAVCLSQGTPRPNVGGQIVAMKSYQDPGQELLKALARNKPPVIPGSRCFADLKQKGMITDSMARPHRSAVAIIVSAPRISANGLASILVERAHQVQAAYGYICMLNRKSGSWVVESCTLTWNT